jgi:hypothetical protein
MNVRKITRMYPTYTYGFDEKRIGPITGRSESSGSCIGSTDGGELYFVLCCSTRRKMKFVIPTAPMLMTVPAMI